MGLELGEIAGTNAGSPDLDLPIEDLDLSERPRNCLKRAQINTIGELITKTEDDLLAITNFGQKSLDEVKQKLDERALSLRGSSTSEDVTMPGTPRHTRRFGGDAAHQRLMMANLVASLIAAEAIVTTEAKAKALRPVAEKMITKAKKGGLHRHRQLVVVHRRQGDGAQALRPRSRLGTPSVRVATRASSSSAPATATTRPWRASSWCSSSGTEPVTRVRMLVAYDGSGFAGFAPNPGVTTVGATLADTLERVLRQPADGDVRRSHRRRRARVGSGRHVRHRRPIRSTSRRCSGR